MEDCKTEKNIRLKIERLKEEKENRAFGFSKGMDTLFIILTVWATATLSISVSSWKLTTKVVAWIFNGVILFFAYKVFNPELKKREKRLEEIAKAINEEYQKLEKHNKNKEL